MAQVKLTLPEKAATTEQEENATVAKFFFELCVVVVNFLLDDVFHVDRRR